MLSRAVVFASFAVVLGSCVSYDFEPVVPSTSSLNKLKFRRTENLPKPDLFLVVDKSGSMGFGVDAPGCNCPTGSCPAGCPTRWSELKAAMGPFLSTQGTIAHFGMVPYPPIDAQACTGAVASDIANYGVDVNRSPDTDLVAMQAGADAVFAKIQGITPVGGTPTGTTLSALLSYAPIAQDPLIDRNHFALLLTDGLPNCNNPASSATCTCTAALGPSGCSANLCLDDDPTTAEIARLKDAKITTIVLGFGAETTIGLGPATLAKMAAAGEFERKCLSDADCGAGDSCSAATTLDKCGMPQRTCARRFFQAGNAAELASALTAIQGSIGSCAPCLFTLDEPVRNLLGLEVTLEGLKLLRDQPNGYRFDPSLGQVEVLGTSCAAIKASSTLNPANVELKAFSEVL